MKFLAFLTVVSASVVLSAAQAVEIGAIEIFSGACEPSGALALRGAGLDGGFLIANDEDNILRLYVPGTAKPIPATGADLNGPLGLDPADEDDKVDFEAAATIGDRNFLIGSHSRSNKGRRRLSRETFLSVSIAGPSDNPQLSVSKPATLIQALAKVDAIKKSIALDDVKHEQLAAEANGLNIEGLAQGLDGASALIGLRNPLTDRGEAIVVPLRNPDKVIDEQAEPELGAPLFLDLGGRGIRSMEYSPRRGDYLIAAGPRQASGDFVLFSWTGKQGDIPTPMDAVNNPLASLDEFHTEALLVDTASNRVRLFSDDGDLPDPHGTPCQKLPDPDSQHFRSIEISP